MTGPLTRAGRHVSAVAALLAICLSAVGCGADGNAGETITSGGSTATTSTEAGGTSSTESTTSGTVTSTTSAPPAGSGGDFKLDDARGRSIDVSLEVRRLVVGAAAAKQPQFAASTKAATGDVVQVRVIPKKLTDRRARMTLRIDAGPSSAIKITAGGFASDPSARASVKATRGRLRVVSVGYTCFAGAPSFCPPEIARRKGRTWVLVGTPIESTPFVVTLTTKSRPRPSRPGATTRRP